MRLLPWMDISSSALSAEQLRLDLVANNLANINTTRTAEGGPYRRRVAVFAELLRRTAEGVAGHGVRVAAVVEDNGPPLLVYDPDHPDANAQGYVELPPINVVNEMVDMLTATRAYEASLTVLNAGKAMAQKALDLGR